MVANQGTVQWTEGHRSPTGYISEDYWGLAMDAGSCYLDGPKGPQTQGKGGRQGWAWQIPNKHQKFKNKAGSGTLSLTWSHWSGQSYCWGCYCLCSGLPPPNTTKSLIP